MASDDGINREFLECFEPHFMPSSEGQQHYKEPDENYIQRHILDCLGALIKLKRKRSHIQSLESKIFFLAVSSVAASASDAEDHELPNVKIKIKNLIMRSFPATDYVPLKPKTDIGHTSLSLAPPRGASHWLCGHWAGIVGHIILADDKDDDDFETLFEEDPAANRPLFDDEANDSTPAHLAVTAADANEETLALISAMAEENPLVAFEKDSNGWLPLHSAAAHSNSVEMLELLLPLNISAPTTATSSIHGRFPIHILAGRADLLEDQKIAMIKCLVAADPTTSSALNGFGCSILHTICSTACPSREAVVRFCLDSFPQLASMKSGQSGSLPLHDICSCAAAPDEQPANAVRLVLGAYKEGIKVPDSSGSLPLHWAALKLDLASLKIIVGANPSALVISSMIWGQPFHRAVTRTDSEGLDVVKYLYEQRPGSICEVTAFDNWLPLHSAANVGSLEIIAFLASKCPEAAAARCVVASEREYPLHLFMRRKFYTTPRNIDTDPPGHRDIDVLRLLLRCYPQGAGVADRKGVTPYHMASRSPRMSSTLVKRLLLRADPTIDPTGLWLRRLNYMERRMAMFLAYSAVPQTTTGSVFVRHLRAMKDKGLLWLIVSFL